MSIPTQLQKWMDHIKSVRAKHPNMKYKDILILAKKSYKK